jgi:methylenetetrahydrofolate reductase (NADPH)
MRQDTTSGLASKSEDAGPEIERIGAFMRASSFEITRPNAEDFKALHAALAPAAQIYLTAVPGRPIDELVRAACLAREFGFEPVPHLAARHFTSLQEIERFVVAVARAGAVTKIMLVGGDSPPRQGRVADALTVLQSGILQTSGLKEVGLAGFPDGHPVLSDEELELALVTKTAAAQSAGLDAHIVTQLCFEAESIVRWLEWLRARGIQAPVRVGFAGPTNLMTWLKFAHRCGVRASAEALASRSGLARHAFKSVAPDSLVRAVAGAACRSELGELAPHVFVFGGIGATARWAESAAKGQIVLNNEGFEPARPRA